MFKNIPSILMSTQPQWCEKIFEIIGENEDKTPIYKKRIEVRKTRPKYPTPFKVYIYCTKGKFALLRKDNEYRHDHWEFAEFHKSCGNEILNSKVIGEFICDKIYYHHCDIHDNDTITLEELSELSCVSEDGLLAYADKGGIYGWHISNLVIYDEPRELSEFYISDNAAIQSCNHREIVGQPEYKTAHNGWIKGSYICNANGEPDWCTKCKTKPLKRPPQSWCYVKRAGEM